MSPQQEQAALVMLAYGGGWLAFAWGMYFLDKWLRARKKGKHGLRERD